MEDNPADILLFREALRVHEVHNDLTVLRNGAMAIEYIDAVARGEVSCPGLVVLDLNLPKVSGRDVLKRIRETLRCAEAPVVILSSSGAEKDREEARHLGATQYLRKPSDLSKFMEIGLVLKTLLETGAESE